MDNDTFEKGMALIIATYPNLNMSEKTIRVWRKLLDDIPGKDFESAIIVICQTVREIYPGTNMVALIRESIGGTMESRAIGAWAKVIKAIREVGQYKTIQFDDPIIHSVIEVMGGWEGICEGPESETKWIEKEFVKLYPVCAKKAEHPEKLIGFFDRMNIASGFKEQEVVRIGSGFKKRVLLEGEKGNGMSRL